MNKKIEELLGFLEEKYNELVLKINDQIDSLNQVKKILNNLLRKEDEWEKRISKLEENAAK